MSLFVRPFHSAPHVIHYLATIILSLALFAMVAPARAQAPVTLAAMHISLWPEYDQPSMLVILDGELASSVSLPASVTVAIPKAAGKPTAVAVSSPNGDLLDAPYTTSETEAAIMVEFVASTSGFRVEYYDPALAVDGDEREYVFNWLPNYPVQQVLVRVQQPYGASNLVSEPALTSTGLAADGLSYYQGDLGSLAAGQPVALRLSYQKPDATLSADAIGAVPVDASQPASSGQPATIAGQANTNAVLIGVGAVGAALIGLGAFWYLRSTRLPRPAPARAKARRSGSRGSQPVRSRARHRARAARPVGQSAARTGGTAAQAAGYCTQCGNRLLAGDRFCRNCGAKMP